MMSGFPLSGQIMIDQIGERKFSETVSSLPQHPQRQKRSQIVDRKYGLLKLQRPLLMEEQFTENQSEQIQAPSHECYSKNQEDRCDICEGTIKAIFRTPNQLNFQKPYSLSYIDYTQLFSGKLDSSALQNNNIKQYLQIDQLSALREWALHVLDRPSFYYFENISTQSIKPKPTFNPSIYQDLNIKICQSITTHSIFQSTSVSPTKELYPSETQQQFVSDKHQQNQEFKVESEEKLLNQGSKQGRELFRVFGNFEGSNVSSCAINKQNRKCQLLLRSDTNTKGCLHWFMFTVKVDEFWNQSLQNSEFDQDTLTINFSILNNQRSRALYKQGMQIAVLDSTKMDKGWHRAGKNIYYYRSNVTHEFFQQRFRQTDCNLYSSQSQGQNQQLLPIKNKQNYWTMDFSYTFTSPNQCVTFAYCFPYTLSNLVEFFTKIEDQLIKQQQGSKDQKSETSISITTSAILYKRKTITTSRLNLPLFKLSITSSTSSSNIQKKCIYILARQHPGETPSSYVCQGVIKSILSNTPQAIFLRDNYVFKIVPMMNPDGVVVGNSRCNISGADLNRKWDNPDPILHPEVHEVKKRLIKTHEKRQVIIFCDLHGHSAKKHSFFYGCNKASEGGSASWTETHLLPRILSRITPHLSLGDCKFRVTEDKKNTARVIVYNELRVPNSFTLETSFFGYDDFKCDNKPTQYTISDLEGLGNSLVSGFVEFFLVMEVIKEEIAESKGKLNWNRPKVDKIVKIIPSEQIPNKNKQKQKSIFPNSKLNLDSLVDKVEQIDEGNGNQKKIEEGNQKKIDEVNEKQGEERNHKIEEGNQKKGEEENQKKGDEGNQIKIDEVFQKKGEEEYLKNIEEGNQKNSDDILQRNADEGNQKKIEENSLNDTKVIKKKNFWADIESEDSFFKSIQQQLCPLLQPNWREYFGRDELEKTFKKIDRGEDPNDNESISGSDSEAEQDIIKQEEFSGSIKQNNNNNNNNNTTTKNNTIYFQRPVQRENIYLTETRTQEGQRKKKKDLSFGDQRMKQEKQESKEKIQLQNKKEITKILNSSPVNERNKWTPSPLIQSYKMQLEIKKQQFKKQCYPIAKVGQNFDTTYQSNNNQSHLNNNGSSNCILEDKSMIYYSSQSNCEAKITPFPALTKNGNSPSFLEKRINEIKQNSPDILRSQPAVQQQQQLRSQVIPMNYPISQPLLYNSTFPSQVSQTTTTYKSPKELVNFLDSKHILSPDYKEAQYYEKNLQKKQMLQRIVALPVKQPTVSQLSSTYTALGDLMNTTKKYSMKDKTRSGSFNNYSAISNNSKNNSSNNSHTFYSKDIGDSYFLKNLQSNLDEDMKGNNFLQIELFTKKYPPRIVTEDDKNERNSLPRTVNVNNRTFTLNSANSAEENNSSYLHSGMAQLKAKQEASSNRIIQDRFLVTEAFVSSSKKVGSFMRKPKRRKESSEDQQELNSSPSEAKTTVEGVILQKSQVQSQKRKRSTYLEGEKNNQIFISPEQTEMFGSSIMNTLTNITYVMSKPNVKGKIQVEKKGKKREGEKKHNSDQITFAGNKDQKKIRAISMNEEIEQRKQSPIWKLISNQEQSRFTDYSGEQISDFIPLSNISHRQSLSGYIPSNNLRAKKQML